MRLYNTLTGKKEELKNPPESGLNIFVCGPTVYDYSHIGHARAYIFFDAFVKFLRHRLNFKVNYLQNITDIDDKIIRRAQEQGSDVKELAASFTQAYYQDMAALGITAVDTYAPATNYIPQIISQVERLVKKGFAYAAEGSVYFDVRKFPEYGRLSHQKISGLKEGVRVETEPGKKYFADFALWKKSNAGEPSWDSPWGPGRPGWHIEDTAITEKHFGPRYHIHGGGLDLIFPHHEAEIAQMESVSGLKPLAQFWMHAGLLNVEGEKMSKSLGNFITIRDFLKNNSAALLRFFILSSHYRSPLDFSAKNLAMAEASLARIVDFVNRLKEVTDAAARFPVDDFTNSFWNELKDDFNTPQALAALFDLIKETNKFIDSHKLSQSDAKKIIDFMSDLNDILGILPQEEKVPAEVMTLAAEREKARAVKDFQKSDELRAKIQALGWDVDDTPTGPKLSKS